jgi:hypothetical protein
MTHWADKYVGLPAQGKWPCWQLVRSVWVKELDFNLPSFEEQDLPEGAIALGDREFHRVSPGSHQPFDAVMMYTPRLKKLGGYGKVEAHIGIIVKDDLVLHVHIGYTSSIESLKGLAVSRIIRGPWKLKNES